MIGRTRILAGIAALAAVALATAAPAARADSATPLSDASVTRWANPVQVVPVRAAPDAGAARVATTHLLTEDQRPEVYLLVAQEGDWVQLRVPSKPDGRTGWVPVEALSSFHSVTTRIVVSRSALTLTLYRGAKKLLQVPVGVGAAATPTPTGSFWIREKLQFANSPVYGTRALGTSAYAHVSDWPGGGVVGIHGTDEPNLIPGRPSHGCVRVRNADMARVYALTPIGTPVEID